jgi:predicted DNA-binding ArsR family transcriptional regulator
MENKEDKIETLEDLALLIQNTMASKEDIKEVKEDIHELREEMNERFEKVDAQLDHLDARVGRIEADIQELRGEIVYRHEFDDVLARIKYLEKKLGIESGV